MLVRWKSLWKLLETTVLKHEALQKSQGKSRIQKAREINELLFRFSLLV